MELSDYLKKQALKIEKELERLLAREPHGATRQLHEAMRYSVLGGGKRIRPVLCLAASEAVGGKESEALPAALAIELIHSYSLVHDDLPCMDNDDERRGKPTCHKKFGESTALLAGDALLTLAFETLTRIQPRRLEVVGMIAKSAGAAGMVGGQAADLQFSGKTPGLPELDFIHTHKTGALIAVSVQAGAVLGGATPKSIKALSEYGRKCGFLFQIVDDILDGDGYAKLLGAQAAKEKAAETLASAKTVLKPLGKKAVRLEQIADFIFKREN